MRITLIFLLMVLAIGTRAQKKALDHTVYDSWQNIGERKISNDGKWVAYCVDVQEGDGELFVQSNDGRIVKSFPRGYNLQFTEDNQFLVFKIKPLYKDTRQARIKKKKPEDSPKDTLAYLELGKDTATKVARVKSYKLPEKSGGWLAFLMEKPIADSSKSKKDSLSHKLDSLIRKQPMISAEKKKDELDADGDAADASKTEEGTDLVVVELTSRQNNLFKNISEYYWSKPGNILLMKGTPAKKDSLGKNLVAIWRSHENHTDTISRGGSDFKNFVIDEHGYQLAFVAERDSGAKSLQKFYKLWYWRNGDDSASMLLDKMSQGMKLGNTISENSVLNFSKSGSRLFLGTAPVQPPKDTSLAEIDLVKVDIWNYKDDYIQTQQLKRLDQDLKQSYLGVYHFKTGQFVQLADKYLPLVVLSEEGDGDQFFGSSDFGKRVESQWTGNTRNDLFAVDAITGKRTLIKADLDGFSDISYTGKYVIWYDNKVRNYFTWSNGVTRNISSKIKTPLVDEENDIPDSPSPYGIVKWMQNDEAVFIYDRFDIWQVDPKAVANPICITGGEGRQRKTVYRYIQTDPEEMFIKPGQDLLLTSLDKTSKDGGIAHLDLKTARQPSQLVRGAFLFGRTLKAKLDHHYLYTKENYLQSPNLFVNMDWKEEVKLSNTNPQQKDYNWGNASLFSWKAYNGKPAQGIVYKPENFDPSKKYPLICYFYERLTDGLNQYIPPVPTASRLNISFFVSRGYIVLAPDIYYNNGHPGKAAVDYVLSGARALVKKGWVDSTRMGIQGQSWGGYQVAYIITATSAFKAAWAGAPVVNMTSAYGGIRWESGLNRQFQYERQQSRIGASLWEKPQLYLENSPLFHLTNVKTPVVIMSNDNDGAVTWYQGIEMFTALRRLGKPVWLLNYNGEAHNLVERKNRKDIQMREQQFFDWMLKGDREPQWLKEGVPATEKGKQWGFQLQ